MTMIDMSSTSRKGMNPAMSTIAITMIKAIVVTVLYSATITVAKVASTEDPQCGLYMAPSTIPNAGMGIFTAKTVHINQPIGFGDVIIPLLDVRWHNEDFGDTYRRGILAWNENNDKRNNDNDKRNNDNTTASSAAPSRPYFHWPLDDYVWDGIQTMGMHRETIPVDIGGNVEAFAPGLDAAINCHLAVLNVDRKHPPSYDFTTIPHTGPGVGAMTPYFNSTTIATHRIPAGGELFKHYGDKWFASRWQFRKVPLSTDYPRIQELLHKFRAIVMKDSNSVRLQKDVYKFVSMFRPFWRALYALPITWDGLQYALDHDLRSYFELSTIRDDLHTLSEARCLDNFRYGKSKIPDAGRGVFASRKLKKGQVVTGSPLVHLSRDSMAMYGNKDIDVVDSTDEEDNESDEEGTDNLETTDESNETNETPTGGRTDTETEVDVDMDTQPPRKVAIPDVDEDPIGQQILLNYCWGHADSLVLLCPYGIGVNFINHGNQDHRPNLSVRWAPNGHMGHNETWLSMPIADLLTKETIKPSLAWDFVATRDIDEGEELLLDYGPAWQEAWTKHVIEWEAKKERQDPEENSWTDEYKPAAEFRDEIAGDVLRTAEEQEDDPYPPNVEMVCHGRIMPGEDASADAEDMPDHELWPVTNDGLKCSIEDRMALDDTTTVYTVSVPLVDDANIETATVIENVPRKMISFRDVHMSTGLHFKGAFRHDARIPDDLLPSVWRNARVDTDAKKSASTDPDSDPEPDPVGVEKVKDEL